LRQLELFRCGKPIELETFLESLELYLWELDFLMISELPGKLRTKYRSLLKRQRKHAAVRFMHGSLATTLQLVVPPLGAAMTGYQTLHAGFGTLKDVRDAGRGYLEGYILGRSIEVESLLVGILASHSHPAGLA